VKTFRQGDIVFSDYGEELEYLCQIQDGHVVRAILGTDDDEQRFGTPEIRYRVFGTAPMQRYAAEAAEAIKQLDAARTELREIGAELALLKEERGKLLKRLSSHPVLEPVVEFLDGKLTHVATFNEYGGGIAIRTVAEAVAPRDESDRRSGQVRLLALYGGFSGPEKSTAWNRDSLRWQLSSYSDGSGSNVTCILGTSEANVRERLQAYLDREFPKKGLYQDYVLLAWAESAIDLGLRVPSDLEQLVHATRGKRAAAAKKRAEDAVRNAEAALIKAQEDLAAFLPENGK